MMIFIKDMKTRISIIGFERTVKKQLTKLKKEQILKFKCICTLRGLPYLTSTIDFSHWKSDEVQSRLFSAFKELDILMYDVFSSKYHLQIYTEALDIVKVTAFIALMVGYNVDKNIILNDLQLIKSNTPEKIKANISSYGEAWTNFIAALKHVGCDYWADYYIELFKNDFQINEERLKSHFRVPDEILEQGAAAVGNYLEELSKKT